MDRLFEAMLYPAQSGCDSAPTPARHVRDDTTSRKP
jgi:hypothetical protein